MKQQRGEIVATVLFILIVLILIAAPVLSNMECKAKWKRSGMKSVTWSPIQGCLVELPDGRWLPEERIREIDIPKEPIK